MATKATPRHRPGTDATSRQRGTKPSLATPPANPSRKSRVSSGAGRSANATGDQVRRAPKSDRLV